MKWEWPTCLLNLNFSLDLFSRSIVAIYQRVEITKLIAYVLTYLLTYLSSSHKNKVMTIFQGHMILAFFNFLILFVIWKIL